MEVKDSNDHVSAHTDDVMDRWENDFENLFSNSTKTLYDDNHRGDIKQRVQYCSQFRYKYFFAK